METGLGTLYGECQALFLGTAIKTAPWRGGAGCPHTFPHNVRVPSAAARAYWPLNACLPAVELRHVARLWRPLLVGKPPARDGTEVATAMTREMENGEFRIPYSLHLQPQLVFHDPRWNLVEYSDLNSTAS